MSYPYKNKLTKRWYTACEARIYGVNVIIEPLVKAMLSDNMENFNMCLKEYPESINKTYKDYKNEPIDALFIAIDYYDTWKFEKFIAPLIEAGANINGLHMGYAVHRKNVFKIIIDKAKHLPLIFNSGETILEYAIKSGNFSCINYLWNRLSIAQKKALVRQKTMDDLVRNHELSKKHKGHVLALLKKLYRYGGIKPTIDTIKGSNNRILKEIVEKYTENINLMDEKVMGDLLEIFKEHALIQSVFYQVLVVRQKKYIAELKNFTTIFRHAKLPSDMCSEIGSYVVANLDSQTKVHDLTQV